MSMLQKKVLVVDDDPVIGRSFSGVLSGKGYAVITAHDGEDALAKINSDTYDIVFTDIKMPGMSGIEVAQRIRERQPWLPVVIITGFGSDDNRKQAEAAGVSDFLDKPLSPEMIERSAADALKRGEAPLDLVLEAGPEEAPATRADEGKPKGMPESIIVFPPNVKLYFAAPFIGLAHTITLPLEGLDMLGAMGEEGLVKRGVPAPVAWFLRKVALFSAAPFVELAYLAALPLAGLGILSWMGLRNFAKSFGMSADAETAAEQPAASLQEGARKAVLHAEAAPEKKAAQAEGAPATAGDYLKHVFMLFTAPFIGLVYILTFPFVGLGTLAAMGAKEAVRAGLPESVALRIKNVVLFFVSPFIGLAYMLALPFVGLGMLAWIAAKAIKSRFVK